MRGVTPRVQLFTETPEPATDAHNWGRAPQGPSVTRAAQGGLRNGGEPTGRTPSATASKRPPRTRQDRRTQQTEGGGGLGAFATEAERAVVAAEAKRAGTHSPPVSTWVLSAAETYAGELNRADWPQEAWDLKLFASNVRRTEEILIKKAQVQPPGAQVAYLAWTKQEGLAPQTLNRTDQHGREIPF